MRKYKLELNKADVVLRTGSVDAVWGFITGDIKSQTDLQDSLNDIKESIPEPYNDTIIKNDINHIKEELSGKLDGSSLNGLNEKINQKANKADVYTKEEVDGKITAIPKPDLSAYSTTVENDKKYQPKGNYLTSIPAEYITETELASKGYITDISGKADKSSVYTKSEIDTKLGNIDTLLDQINGEVI